MESRRLSGRIIMTFKARLITFILSATTLVMAVFFFIAYMSLDILQNRFAEEAIRGKSVLWQEVISVQLEHMEASTSSVTRASDSLKALKNANLNELNEATMPTFNRLSSSDVISRLQLADTSGTIVFSSPKPFAGKTVKTLVKKALDENKVFKGLERDDDGVMVAEIAFPLFYRGKAVGVAVYMTDMTKAISNFKDVDGSEIHIFSDSGKIEYSTDQDQFGSIQTQPTGTAIQYKQSIDEQIMSLVQLPILNTNDEHIANLLTATDYTDSYNRQSSVFFSGLVIGLIAFIACMVLIYWFIVHSFKPMTTCLKIIGRISAGDLTEKFEVDCCSGEFGELMIGLESMQHKLSTMIEDINTAAHQIEVSAGNLDKVTQQSSQRVSTQSNITQQLVSNIDQLIQASNQVNTSADESTLETRKADGEVKKARGVVTETVQTIKNISEQVNRAEAVVKDVHSGTENIGSVLDVIKGIAEQTNLLALNAAIEAARAGEQGRGFAVVADEVRTLASRTQESTREIETMIDALQKSANDAVSKMTSSIDMVDKGVEVAHEADDSFNLIAETMSSISGKSINIANAANNQMTLSEKMHSYVQSINAAAADAVDGNNSTVNSSDELIKLAEQLKQKVSQFRT